MTEVLNLMPVLAVVIGLNILLGLYKTIGVQKLDFDKTKLINGIIKAAIIAGAFLGFAYVFSVVDLSSIGITPFLIIQVSIITYATKGITNLAQIMGIQDLIKSQKR